MGLNPGPHPDEANVRQGTAPSVTNFIPSGIAGTLPPGATCIKTVVVRQIAIPDGRQATHAEYRVEDGLAAATMLAKGCEAIVGRMIHDKHSRSDLLMALHAQVQAVGASLLGLIKTAAAAKQEESPAIEIPGEDLAKKLLDTRLPPDAWKGLRGKGD